MFTTYKLHVPNVGYNSDGYEYIFVGGFYRDAFCSIFDEYVSFY